MRRLAAAAMVAFLLLPATAEALPDPLEILRGYARVSIAVGGTDVNPRIIISACMSVQGRLTVVETWDYMAVVPVNATEHVLAQRGAQSCAFGLDLDHLGADVPVVVPDLGDADGGAPACYRVNAVLEAVPTTIKHATAEGAACAPR